MTRGLRFLFLALCLSSFGPAYAVAAVGGAVENIQVPAAREAPLGPSYTASTENLTKVANAFRLQTYSLTTQVVFAAGLTLTKPVCIQVFYDSYSGTAYSNNLNQAYDSVHGNRLVFNDPNGLGTPRQARLRMNLFEPGSGPCGPRVVGTGFSFPNPFTVNLEPIYYVQVGPLRVTRQDNCSLWKTANQMVRWFTPDDQLHEKAFQMGNLTTVAISGTEWVKQEVKLANDYHLPNAGVYGLFVPSSPYPTKLLPPPLVAGSLAVSQDIKIVMADTARHCQAYVQYKLDRKIRLIPPVPINLGPSSAGTLSAQ